MSNPYAPPPPDREARPDRPSGQRPPQRRRPQGGRPPGERPHDDRPHGERPHGQRPHGEHPQGRRPDPRRPARLPAPLTPVTPPDPALVAVAGRRMRAFLLALLAAIVAERLPLPWQLATVVVSLVAALLGLRAVQAALKARMPRGLVVLAGVGVGISSTVALSMVTVALFWPLPLEQQRCMDRTITITAQNQCAEQYRQGIIDRLGGQPRDGLLDTLVPSAGRG